MRWRERDGVRWLEAELPRARAAFTTRLGGVSAPPYESLNLAILTGDDPSRVRENRHRLAAALELDPAEVVIARQVHGAELREHVAPQRPSPFAEPGPAPPEFDGHHTSTPRLAPLVFVADCLPVALAGPRGVAMLHCGWRGLAGGLVARGVEATAASAAAIGPGIGPCCYRVGPEVLERFEGLGDGVVEQDRLDLVAVTRRQLAGAGVRDIEASGLCTSCDPELFYSHRRDGARTGRQAGVAWLS